MTQKRKLARTVELERLVATVVSPILTPLGFVYRQSTSRFHRHHTDRVDTICVSSTRYYSMTFYFGVFHKAVVPKPFGKEPSLYTICFNSMNYGPGLRNRFPHDTSWIFERYPFDVTQYESQFLEFMTHVILPWMEQYSTVEAAREGKGDCFISPLLEK